MVWCEQCTYTQGEVGTICKCCGTVYVQTDFSPIVKSEAPSSKDSSLSWKPEDTTWWDNQSFQPIADFHAKDKNGVRLYPGDKIDRFGRGLVVLDPPACQNNHGVWIVFRDSNGKPNAIRATAAEKVQ